MSNEDRQYRESKKYWNSILDPSTVRYIEGIERSALGFQIQILMRGLKIKEAEELNRRFHEREAND